MLRGTEKREAGTKFKTRPSNQADSCLTVSCPPTLAVCRAALSTVPSPGGTLATHLVTSPAYSAISLLEIFHHAPSFAPLEPRGAGVSCVQKASAEQPPGGTGGVTERRGDTAAVSQTLLPQTERLSLYGNRNRLENSL